MTELFSTKCCGVWEINDLSKSEGPIPALKALEKGLRDGFTDFMRPTPSGRLKPFVIFTGVTKRFMEDHASGRVDNYGQTFANFLTSHGLGPVIASKVRENHTTKNMIRVWIWHPDYPALFSYLDGLKETENVQTTPSST